MISHRRLLTGGAWLSAGNGLSSIFAFVRNIAIARLVSVEDFGVVVLLSLTLSVIETVSNLAVDRLLVQAPDGDDPQLQATAHALQVARGVAGGLVVFFLATTIAALFNIPHAVWALQALSLVPVIRGLAHLDTVRLQREMHFKPTFWVVALPPALSLGLAVPLAYWLRDYSAMVWAMLAQVLAQAAITHVLASRPYRWAWNRATVIRILSFSWPLLANGLLMFAIFQGDNAVIAAAFTPDVVGWYGAAFMMAMAPAMLVTTVMQGLLLPPLSKCQHVPEEFNRRHQQTVQVSLATGLFVSVVFAVLGPELLVALFGTRYGSGTGVVILLGLAQGVRIAKAGQFVSSIALARTKDPLIANLARGAALLLAIGLVVRGYGPLAVAASGVVGEVASYVIAVVLLSKRRDSQGTRDFGLFAGFVVLLALSCAVGAVLRAETSLFAQCALAVAWLFGVTAAFAWMSPAVRGILTKIIRE